MLSFLVSAYHESSCSCFTSMWLCLSNMFVLRTEFFRHLMETLLALKRSNALYSMCQFSSLLCHHESSCSCFVSMWPCLSLNISVLRTEFFRHLTEALLALKTSNSLCSMCQFLSLFCISWFDMQVLCIYVTLFVVELWTYVCSPVWVF